MFYLTQNTGLGKQLFKLVELCEGDKIISLVYFCKRGLHKTRRKIPDMRPILKATFFVLLLSDEFNFEIPAQKQD